MSVAQQRCIFSCTGTTRRPTVVGPFHLPALYGLELSPGFHPGPDRQCRLFQTFISKTTTDYLCNATFSQQRPFCAEVARTKTVQMTTRACRYSTDRIELTTLRNTNSTNEYKLIDPNRERSNTKRSRTQQLLGARALGKHHSIV